MLTMEVIGAILSFFGISLPIVKVSGSLIIAFMGRSALTDASSESLHVCGGVRGQYDDTVATRRHGKDLLSAHLPRHLWTGDTRFAIDPYGIPRKPEPHGEHPRHTGIFLAVVVSNVIVYVCSALRLTSIVSESTATGIPGSSALSCSASAFSRLEWLLHTLEGDLPKAHNGITKEDSQ